MRRLIVATLVAVLPTAAGGASESADPFEAPQPALASFAETGALTITLEQLPAEVLVHNNSARDLTLTATLYGPFVELAGDESTDSKQEDPVSAPRTAALVFCEQREPEGLTLTLDPAGSERITICRSEELESAHPALGSYAGFLALHDGEKAPLRRKIVLSVGTGELRPAFDKWTIRLTRRMPFIAEVAEVGYLPLLPNGEPPPLPRLIGHVAAEQSEPAEVHWTGVDQGRARLELRGLDRFTPKYEGAIQLSPAADPAGKVTLTVAIKAHWLLAVVCLGLGIAAAHLLQQFIQVRRAVWLARERNAQLGIDFEEAQAQFRRAATTAAGQPPAWAGISIGRDMAKRRERLRESLDALEGLTGQAIEQNEEFKAARAELDRLEAAAAAWPTFAAELAELDAAREKIREPPPLPPPLVPAQEKSPGCLRLADGLLSPVELSLAAPDQEARAPRFLDRRPRVVAAASLLGDWHQAERRLQEQLDISRALLANVPEGNPDRDEVEKIGRELDAAWSKLWRVESAEALTGVTTTLHAILDRMVALVEYLPKEHPLLAGDRPAIEVFPAPSAAARPSETELRDDRERRDYYAGLRRRYEGVTLFVAFALAVVSGLNTLYIGNEFATQWHYVQALTWGATTKLALDTVVAAIGHLPALAQAVRGGR